ncbi:hypothetical protein Tel_06855 [Candidatus Tenderia electrophaga]|jgi:hypothetical protein|uniref:SOS cell division inhibitor SulA n=1 Tax=Candidatus Tenderia electrophaga TaxID=1748243 RepID=A0A0S2TCM3_9GAMM|nr:hypothetical protein Tel_06855 [Candidatus Tenderia electrophaga]
MDGALQQLLRNNRLLWRGRGGVMPAGGGLATGFAALDTILPEGGWPRDALLELVVPQWGIGELQLLLPAMQAVARAGRWVVWIAPPHIPYAPALADGDVPLNRVLLLQPRRQEDIPWAMEKALHRHALVLAWPGRLKPVMVRRLQLAAEAGRSLGVLFQTRDRGASPAALRLRLQPTVSGLQVHILKSRAADRRQTVELALM